MNQEPTEKINTQVDQHMNTGVDDKDEYWSLFRCKDAVNTAIVEAYRLGYKRGLIDGMEKITDSQRVRLCAGATSLAPISCFDQSKGRNLTDDQRVILCQGTEDPARL